MSTLPLFLKAAGIGVAVAAPVGPMSLLCMRRTLTHGWRRGLAIGAGIATGDGAYASVAALGLAAVSRFMLAHERALHLAAGLFLLYLGLKPFFASGRDGSAATGKPARSLGGDFAGSVLLTLTNPPTIIMFAAVLTALAPPVGFAMVTAFLTVAGVFLGSLLWWTGMVALLCAFRRAIGRRARTWIDRVAGAILAASGLVEVRRAV